MKVVAYPADVYGCGSFRLRWPGAALAAQGHDVTVIDPEHRDLRIVVGPGELVEDVQIDPSVDVVVLQRVTHPILAQAVPVLRRKGVAVVIDVDDDLSSVHPSNPAYATMHPRNERVPQPRNARLHSWRYLEQACRDATLVVTSTPALLDVYAAHGRGRVVENRLPAHYFGVPHIDSDLVGWPAALVSHPDDPSAAGGAVARIVNDGGRFQIAGEATGCGAAFGLTRDPDGMGPIDLMDWPAAVARLGIGIAPLADTRFNRAKSWLKPLEMAAVGVPCVMSPRAEYARLHAMGVGLLADRPRTWYQRLNFLRTNESARLDLAAQGREVAAGLRLEPDAWRWWEAWSDALAIQRGVKAVAAA